LPQPPSASLHALRRPSALALLLVLLITAVGASARPGVAAEAPSRDEQLRFMWAMAGQESGWDYYARNGSSGAFGKYQIMPFNWPAWAEKYLGDRRADQTPWNQEQVAYGKLRDLHRWLGSWKRVAYWWLTGSSEKNEKRWSAYAKGYVKNIMALRRQAPARGGQMPPRTSSKAKAGDWRRSDSEQRLRRSPGGPVWPRGGELRDGQVLKVRAGRKTDAGVRWIEVVTADGRLGWLKQQQTVPTHKPHKPKRWADVSNRGRPIDRRPVRPRPH
jgi:hypothetical protein